MTITFCTVAEYFFNICVLISILWLLSDPVLLLTNRRGSRKRVSKCFCPMVLQCKLTQASSKSKSWSADGSNEVLQAAARHCLTLPLTLKLHILVTEVFIWSTRFSIDELITLDKKATYPNAAICAGFKIILT